MPINLANMGYDDVPAAMPGEFQQLPADGYVCNVVLADITHSKAGNLMLVLFIDIAQGDFKGHFKAAVDRVKSFAPVDANDLRGLLIGFVFAEEEYQKPDGSISSRVFPKFPKYVVDIQSGNFAVPQKKSLPTSSPAQSNDIFGGSRIDPSDLPF